MVQEGTFREDLLYRIKVVHLHVPPLRERKEDIPALVDHFFTKYCRENDKLLDEPGTINSDPFGEGWFMKLTPSDLKEMDSLMTPEEYDEYEKSQ